MPCDVGTEGDSRRSSTPPAEDDLGTKTDLIILVKQHRELYDKNDPLYKNNAHKGVLWNQIAKNLGGVHSAKKVREQFSYMRRRFEEEYYNRKHGILRPRIEPDAANYRKPLFVFDQLTFLEPFIQRDESEENADVENKPGTSESGEENSWLEYLQKLTNGTSEVIDLNLNNISVSNAANTDTSSFPTLSLPSASPSTSVASASGSKDNVSALPCKRRRKNPPMKKESRDVSVTSNANPITAPSPTPAGFNSAAFISGNLPASSTTTSAPSTLPSNIDLSEMVKLISDSVKDDLVNQECSLFGKQLALDLQKLNPKSRIRARIEILSVLARFITD
uniref:MADF domain-containing protein n=1 Tax=Panagrellus redivivus TaxID=6233 RepID=A0A7E4W0K1_PANRE